MKDDSLRLEYDLQTLTTLIATKNTERLEHNYYKDTVDPERLGKKREIAA